MPMKPLAQMPEAVRRGIRFVLTDIDDTLTVGGRLPAAAFTAMEALRDRAVRVVPITGRPAGWCDHFARMWPVDAVVGENGAFYFRYDESKRRMIRRYWKPPAEREADRNRLEKLRVEILRAVPGCGVSADQRYREADLAVDYCEDVPPLEMSEVRRIVSLFTAAGAQAKISSIHVNGWFGEYDKLSMTRILFHEVFGEDLASIREQVIFSGDSPNDAPMFAFFPHAVGVAGVLRFRDELEAEPAWLTTGDGGFGFAEMAEVLLGGKA